RTVPSPGSATCTRERMVTTSGATASEATRSALSSRFCSASCWAAWVSSHLPMRTWSSSVSTRTAEAAEEEEEEEESEEEDITRLQKDERRVGARRCDVARRR